MLKRPVGQNPPHSESINTTGATVSQTFTVQSVTSSPPRSSTLPDSAFPPPPLTTLILPSLHHTNAPWNVSVLHGHDRAALRHLLQQRRAGPVAPNSGGGSLQGARAPSPRKHLPHGGGEGGGLGLGVGIRTNSSTTWYLHRNRSVAQGVVVPMPSARRKPSSSAVPIVAAVIAVAVAAALEFTLVVTKWLHACSYAAHGGPHKKKPSTRKPHCGATAGGRTRSSPRRSRRASYSASLFGALQFELT